MLKRIASALPSRWHHEIRRWHFLSAIRGNFHAGEPEFDLLPSLVSAGDTVIDVGANVGHYAVGLSRIVGTQGRVIAFEPILETFAILASNVLAANCGNVTLVNAAVSDKSEVVGMSVPQENGSANYYQAKISGDGDRSVFTLSLDILDLPRVSLIKIDVEGHEISVLEGARQVIERDRPALIVEGSETCDSAKWLCDHGYKVKKLAGSPNVLATKKETI